MLAISIDYLTGRSVATAHHDRDAAEWPPHPARLFSALVAAWGDAGTDAEERRALEWLESQEAPAVVASDGFERSIRTTYVPVNDANEGFKKGKQPTMFPELGATCQVRRLRVGRTFPSFTPREATAYVIWRDAEADESLRGSLRRLLGRVSYLGHSSSLVRARLVDEPPEPTHVPVDAGGELVLRVPTPGQLEALEHAFELYRTTRVRGQLPCRFQAYARSRKPDAMTVPRGSFGEMVIFRRIEGPQLPIEATELVTSTLRKAVMSACDEPVPEVLSGHRRGGARSEMPHVAYVALPHVGRVHATGQLLGAAAVLPRGVTEGDRSTVHRALARVSHLTMGRAGAWMVDRTATEPPPTGVLPETWNRASLRWASVTPMELDAFPDDPYGEEAIQLVARSCDRTGLPRPDAILLGPDSIIPGVPPWRAFSRHARPRSGARRPLVHVVLDFAEPVSGPVLLGASRYRGLGLLRPVGGR